MADDYSDVAGTTFRCIACSAVTWEWSSDPDDDEALEEARAAREHHKVCPRDNPRDVRVLILGGIVEVADG